jgi:glucose/arabinose dehydrogenase
MEVTDYICGAKHKGHNGGRICFGPDGCLYVSIGDGK